MDFTEDNFKALLEENKRLNGLVYQLQQKLKSLFGRFWGKSSEKIDPNQFLMEFLNEGALATTDEAANAAAEEEESNKTPRKDTSKNAAGKRKDLRDRVPADIPVEDQVIIPDEVLQNPDAYEQISEEVFEELEVVMPQFKLIRIVRPKFRMLENRDVPPIIAPAPKRLIDNCFATVGLILWIVLGKFCDHLPLYRQEKILKQRHGIDISRKTMGNWLHLVSIQLAMIYEALRSELRATHYLQLDETTVNYISPGNKQTKKGYLWAAHAPGTGVLFQWYPSRAHECLNKILKGFTGIIQTDGYEAYKTWLNKKSAPGQVIVASACWAHARRYFYEVKGSPIAKEVLRLIQKLYVIEKELRDNPELDRSTVRLEKSQPILDELETLLEKNRPHPKAKSAVSKAINYSLNRWNELTEYVLHSQMEIDNNLVENAIRPIAIGRKNSLFFGSKNSGQDSAIFYSLIETCRKLEINPADYLRDVFTALPTMTNHTAASWTPSQWKQRKSAETVAAQQT